MKKYVIIVTAIFASVISYFAVQNSLFVSDTSGTYELAKVPVRISRLGDESGAFDVFIGSSEIPYVTVPNIYIEHYHPAEFVSGKLYLIERVAVSAGGSIDSLVVFNENKTPQVLHEGSGIDFRVSDDGSRVAVIDGGIELFVYSPDGRLVSKVRAGEVLGNEELHLMPRMIGWREEKFFLGGQLGQQLVSLVVLDTLGAVVESHDLTKYSVGESALSPKGNSLVLSTFTSSLEAEGTPREQEVEVGVFDLRRSSYQVLANGMSSKRVEPSWVDEHVVTANGFTGVSGRVEYRLLD